MDHPDRANRSSVLSDAYGSGSVVPLTYDLALGRMSELVKDMSATHEAEPQRNEAATRLQLIDRLLFDCLGWDRDNAEVEHHSGGDYADYLLDRSGRRLVVEAKREGAWFSLPESLERITRLSTLFQLGDPLATALTQVERYAQQRGTPYAAVCNGHQLVAFVGSRSDGVAPREGRALVFVSPEDMLDGFQVLWDALTPLGCATRRLTNSLRGPTAAPPPKLSEGIADYPGTAKATDRHLILGTVAALFQQPDVRDERDEEEFLRACYCPPGAYSQLSILNRGVLRTRYSTALGNELQIGLEEARTKEGLSANLVEEVATTSSGREPLVLLGGVGVGKTMFLRHLLRVDAKELADDAIVLYVNLGQSAVLGPLDDYVVRSFKEQLLEQYEIDIDKDDFLRGTYHGELRRFAAGPNAALKETDPTVFAQREIDRLLELSGNPEMHLQRSLDHLVKLRSQQIIVVLDNVDQRSHNDQEQVFLIAEAAARNWPCTVFVTLRPETFNASRAKGVLSGYQPRAFTIDPPRVERVVVERLRYGAKHYKEEGQLPTWMGWSTSSGDLSRYMDILVKSFSRSERLVTVLVNLSGGNARVALELVSTFVRSPHSAAERLLERNEDRDYLVPPHEFLRAVLLGDREHYQPQSARIPNLFDIATSDSREHFTLPLLLGLLRRAVEGRDEEGYVPRDELYATLQDVGFEPGQVDFAIARAASGGWCERLPPDGEPHSFRITMSGAYANEHLARAFSYLDAVIVDTPIADPAVRGDIKVLRAIRPRLERMGAFLDYLDGAWGASELQGLGLFDWAVCSDAVRDEVAGISQRL